MLINPQLKKVEAIELPDTYIDLYTAASQYINTEILHVFSVNAFTHVLMDVAGFLIKENKAFYSILTEGWPLFGNVICFGTDPLNDMPFDLYREYDEAFFQVRWCDPQTTERNRMIAKNENEAYASRMTRFHPDIPFAERN